MTIPVSLDNSDLLIWAGLAAAMTIGVLIGVVVALLVICWDRRLMRRLRHAKRTCEDLKP